MSGRPPENEAAGTDERVQLCTKRCDTAIGPINKYDFTLAYGTPAQQHVAVLGVQMTKSVREQIERERFSHALGKELCVTRTNAR